MKHWIVKIKSGDGAHFAHVEYPDGARPELGAHILEVDSGPADTAAEAWRLWHVKVGNLKA